MPRIALILELHARQRAECHAAPSLRPIEDRSRQEDVQLRTSMSKGDTSLDPSCVQQIGTPPGCRDVWVVHKS